MSRSNVVPAFLNQSTYAAIRLQMVAVAPSLPGAATFFPKDADYTTIPTHRNTDASLVRQLAQVLHPLIGLELLAPAPTAFAITEYSALPTISASQSFFSQHVRTTPHFKTICAKPRKMADAAVRHKEVKRLRSTFDGRQHVCVVDQYVASGTTVSIAGDLLHAAGVRDVSLIRSNWYEHAQSSDEDPIVPAKSIPQEFFNLIGLQTYESYQAYIEHFANSGFTNKL